MISDPIADMLTQIRNALKVKTPEVVVPFSKVKHSITQIMVKEGYLEKVEKLSDKIDQLRLTLKYEQGNTPAISVLRRISRPGRRIYTNWNKLPWVLNNYGIALVSTSQGIMTNREARKKKIGGEIICEIY